MKVVTWNCCAGFYRKAARLDAFSWDIAVVQECAQRDAERFAADRPLSVVWDGSERKGLAVFARDGIELTIDGRYDPLLEVILPVRIDGRYSLNLLATWTKVIRWEDRTIRYVEVMHHAVARYDDFLRERPAAVIGDLNSNAVFDPKHPRASHSQLVRRLGGIGLRSAYHAVSGEAHGAETAPTHFFWRKLERPFHLDYCFVPEGWLVGARVGVGQFDEWIAESDHCPLFVEIDDSCIGAG